MPGSLGVLCSAIREQGSMSKYVYVRDDRIDGYARNTYDGDWSGMTVNNSAFVMRRVYGV